MYDYTSDSQRSYPYEYINVVTRLSNDKRKKGGEEYTCIATEGKFRATQSPLHAFIYHSMISRTKRS